MSQPITKNRYLKGIARVCQENSGDNPVVGVAFLVAESHLITCAHVVCAALGSLKLWEEIPAADIINQSVLLQFREVGHQYERKAKVVFWRFPLYNPRSDNDIAVLELTEPAPQGFQPLVTSPRNDYVNHEFEVFGFRSGLDIGGWAAGKIVGDTYDTRGRVMVEDPHQTGYAIEPGFSGSPIWSPSLDGAIVGMTVARDKERKVAKVGFMLPVRRLKPALEAIELETLMDILEPQAATLKNPFAIAYRASLGDQLFAHPLTPNQDPAQFLRHNLSTLATLPSQIQPYSNLQLVIALLTLPDLSLPQPLRDRLDGWLRDRLEDLSELRNQAQQRLTPVLNQSAQAQPHLLLWVRSSPDYESQDRYLASALLIPDDSSYDPDSGAGGHFLKAVDRFRDPSQGDTVAGAELEAILQACLQEVNQHHHQDLDDKVPILELMLPLRLLDSEADRWQERDPKQLPADLQRSLGNQNMMTVGHRYQVVLRIADRLEPYLITAKPFWKTKWTKLEEAIRTQFLANQVLIPGDLKDLENFQYTLMEDDCLGVHLINPMPADDRLIRLFHVANGSVPVALWLRQVPPRSRVKQSFKALLDHPIGEITHKIRETRKDAFKAKSKPHVGHHLALVWDNPHLVPPEESAYTMPLDMP